MPLDTLSKDVPVSMIYTGYRDKMEHFLGTNQGILWQIPNVVHLEDSSGRQILEMCFSIPEQEVNLDTKRLRVDDFVVEIRGGGYSHIWPNGDVPL